MTNATGTLFDKGKTERSSPRIMMHVVDADVESRVVFECQKCGHRTDWTFTRSVSDARRGVPCPTCNKMKATT